MKLNQKTLVVLSFLLSFYNISIATNYYLSADGNDSNSGTRPSESWETLTRLNKLVPKPGDSIFFRSGDEWSGTIEVNMWGIEDRPVVYTAYGEGEKPKIYGSEIITGWTKHKGNIYKAKFDKEINQLFVNGKRMKASRYPNNGYLFITSVSDPLKIKVDDLDVHIDYSGAKWFGRTNYFTTSLLEVKSSDSDKLLLKSEPRFPLKPGLGFFLMGKLEFLDEEGEWYYDDKTNTIYSWLPDGENHQNLTIRGSVYEDGAYLTGKDNIIISGLHFLHQSNRGIHLKNSDHVLIEGNDFEYQDGFGVYCRTDAKNITITKNTMTGMNHYGMYVRISNSVISDNILSKIALYENIGLSGTGEDNFGGGIYIAGEDGNNVVSYNRLTDIGFSGILFARHNNIIENNFISNVCLLKSDMGGIYTSWYNRKTPTGPEGSIIRNNIVMNVVGEKNGYTSKRNMGEGIYIDEGAKGVLVENNTIINCSNSGIKLHKTEDIKISNNIIYNARQAIQMLKSQGSGKNIITHNRLYAVRDTDDYLKRQVLINTSEGNALYDHNEYVILYANDEAFYDGSVYCNFKQWANSRMAEVNSKCYSVKLSPGEEEIFLYNDSKQVKNINLRDRKVKNEYGIEVKGNIELHPFSSVILFGREL